MLRCILPIEKQGIISVSKIHGEITIATKSTGWSTQTEYNKTLIWQLERQINASLSLIHLVTRENF